MNDYELNKLHQKKFNALPADLRDRMVASVKAAIHPDDFRTIREAIAENPLTWAYPYHFFFGMGIRNVLRRDNLGEEQYPFLGNLDDYWVALVEAAVKQ